MSALIAGFLLLQFGTSSQSATSDESQEIAIAQRSADQTATRGSARTPQNEDVQSPIAGLAAVGAAAAVEVTPTTVVPVTTTTEAPTTTTTERPTTTTAKPSTPSSAPAPKDSGVTGDDTWTKLAACESGNRNDLGAPYYGYFQFSAGTWTAVGGSGLPSDHTYDEQKAMAQKLQARSGWGQWPACARKLGLL